MEKILALFRDVKEQEKARAREFDDFASNIGGIAMMGLITAHEKFVNELNSKIAELGVLAKHDAIPETTRQLNVISLLLDACEYRANVMKQ